MQKVRIRTGNQISAMDKSGEPHQMTDWFHGNNEKLEMNIKLALDKYSAAQVPGQWARSIVGIGPVIAAGLLAHIDTEPWTCMVASKEVDHCSEATPHPNGICGRKPLTTAGKIWRFAGMDPTVTWEKGQKRPWNATLKTLCWKIGESFVKVSNIEKDVYGKVYKQRKEWEAAKNENYDYAEQAAAGAKRVGKSTDAYKSYSIGKLPDGHLHARAKRYAVKLFLSHYHHVLFESTFGKLPPKPYIIEHGGHVDFIAPPNWPMQK